MAAATLPGVRLRLASCELSSVFHAHLRELRPAGRHRLHRTDLVSVPAQLAAVVDACSQEPTLAQAPWLLLEQVDWSAPLPWEPEGGVQTQLLSASTPLGLAWSLHSRAGSPGCRLEDAPWQRHMSVQRVAAQDRLAEAALRTPGAAVAADAADAQGVLKVDPTALHKSLRARGLEMAEAIPPERIQQQAGEVWMQAGPSAAGVNPLLHLLELMQFVKRVHCMRKMKILMYVKYLYLV
jgi:hypothetical protein